MSAYPEPTPLNNPFPRALSILKNELSKDLELFIYTFEHEAKGKSSMSRQLHLHQEIMLQRAKEIGGKVYLHMQELIQASTDYANGHGKLEPIYERLKYLRNGLKS